MPEKYIAINTHGDFHQIYIYDHRLKNDLLEYRRYDDEGIIIYKTYEACQKRCDELNNTIDN